MVYTMSEPLEARYWFPTHDWPNQRWTSDIVVTVPAASSVSVSTPKQTVKSYCLSAANRSIALTSFGKQLPPYPTPGNRNDGPIRRSEATARRTVCSVSALTLAGEGVGTRTGYGFSVGREPSELDLEEAAQMAAERAVRLLGATQPRSRRLPVVFDPLVTAQILGVMCGALNGESGNDHVASVDVLGVRDAAVREGLCPRFGPLPELVPVV